MPLLLIILVGVLVSGSATTVSTKSHLYTGVGVDDKAFSQDVIFEQPATSAVHCAAFCKQQEGCVTFTFDHEVCRGHTVLVTPSTPSTPAPGARTFTRATWVGTACVSDSDCSQLKDDTSCFQDTCVCTPGFFYSISSAVCVSECQPGKLVQSYMKYENRNLYGQDDINVHTDNVQGCFDLCNANTACLSFEFSKSPTATKNCYISYSMAQGPYQLPFSSKFDYYQRQCE